MRRIRLFGALAALALGLASLEAAAQPLLVGDFTSTAQSDDQQDCITSVNKAAAKVVQAQAKESASCVKDAGRGREPAPTECLTRDTKQKVARAAEKVLTPGCDAVPDFGLADPATDAVDAAKRIDIDLLTDLFGDSLDDTLTNAAVAKCQASLPKVWSKIVKAELDAFLRCKKAGLREGSIGTQPQLAACVEAIATDERGKIAKALAGVSKKAGKKCPSESIATAFPGECAGATDIAEFENCVKERLDCRVCLGLNGIDALAIDCDAFDDGEANSTCPPLECDVGTPALGACWVLSEPATIESGLFPVPGGSCTEACNERGRVCDQAATRQIAGTGGTLANCQSVLDALDAVDAGVSGFDYVPPLTLEDFPVELDDSGSGCVTLSGPSNPADPGSDLVTAACRSLGFPTDCSARPAVPDSQRACACGDESPDVILFDSNWNSGGALSAGGEGGRERANSRCTDSAAELTCPNGFHAFASFEGVGQDLRGYFEQRSPAIFQSDDSKIRSVSNEIIANNWGELFDQELQLSLADAGVTTRTFWTGSKADGTTHPNTCSNWTTNVHGFGMRGSPTETLPGWIENSSMHCNNTLETMLCLCY